MKPLVEALARVLDKTHPETVWFYVGLVSLCTLAAFVGISYILTH